MSPALRQHFEAVMDDLFDAMSSHSQAHHYYQDPHERKQAYSDDEDRYGIFCIVPEKLCRFLIRRHFVIYGTSLDMLSFIIIHY